MMMTSPSDPLDSLASAVAGALESNDANAVRTAVERAIFTHNGLLPLAEKLAPGARWECDPQGLGYPAMQGDFWFAGVHEAGKKGNRGPVLTLSVGASPDPEAAGWQTISFDLDDPGVAAIKAKLWLGLRADRIEDSDALVRGRAGSARLALTAMGWMT